MSISNRPPPPTSVLNGQNEIPIQIKWKKKYTPSLHWVIPEKKNRRGGIEDVRYGISRGIKEIACGISRGDQEKIMWNFQGSWFLVLEFPRDGMHFFTISRGKLNKRKILGGLSNQYVVKFPVCFFSGIAHCIWSFKGTFIIICKIQP